MKYRKEIMLGLIAVIVIALQIPVMLHDESSQVYGYSVEKVLSKDVSDPKTNTANQFDATVNYSDADGYVGVLSKNGESSLKSGSYNPGHVHEPGCMHTCSKNCKNSISEYWCRYCGWWAYNFTWHNIANGKYCPNCGEHSPLETPPLIDQNNHWYDACGTSVRSATCKAGHTGDATYTLTSQTRITPQYRIFSEHAICGKSIGQGGWDTRVYQQDYSGMVYKTVTEYPALVSIEVLQIPDKVKYQEDTDFDPAGMVVEATYEDGHKETIEMKK